MRVVARIALTLFPEIGESPHHTRTGFPQIQ